MERCTAYTGGGAQQHTFDAACSLHPTREREFVLSHLGTPSRLVLPSTSTLQPIQWASTRSASRVLGCYIQGKPSCRHLR